MNCNTEEGTMCHMDAAHDAVAGFSMSGTQSARVAQTPTEIPRKRTWTEEEIEQGFWNSFLGGCD